MAESIVKVPLDATMDYDYIAFSFNGKHSYEDFGIYRTSDGDRYNENLTPTLQDKTAEVPGGDGMYYFGSTHKQRDFSINFAFDNMSENTFREMKEWLNGKEMGDLWFSEAPYKIWTAKVSGQPSMKYIPFEINGKRVYKGEGTVNFIAYYPYAHTPDFVQQAYIEIDAYAEKGQDYKLSFELEKPIKYNSDYNNKVFILMREEPATQEPDKTNDDIKAAIIENTYYSINNKNPTTKITLYKDSATGHIPGWYYYFDISKDTSITKINLKWTTPDMQDRKTIKMAFLIYSGYSENFDADGDKIIEEGEQRKASQLQCRVKKATIQCTRDGKTFNEKILEKNNINPEHPHTRIDGKVFLAYRGFPNYTEFATLSSLTGVNNLYSHGELPSYLVVEHTFSDVQEGTKAARFWIGPTDDKDSKDHILDVTIKYDITNGDKITWDTKTGIITRTRGTETIVVPYIGISCGSIPPKKQMYTDAYQKTYKFHYWYY